MKLEFDLGARKRHVTIKACILAPSLCLTSVIAYVCCPQITSSCFYFKQGKQKERDMWLLKHSLLNFHYDIKHLSRTRPVISDSHTGSVKTKLQPSTVRSLH